MQKSVAKLFIVLLVITSLISSCKKDRGPQGETGTKGKDGSGSTQSASNINVPGSAWTAKDTNEYQWNTAINLEQITSKVINEGSVHVYVQRGASWYPLPLNEGISTIQYGVEPGKIHLSNFYSDPHLETVARPKDQVFRVVTLVN